MPVESRNRLQALARALPSALACPPIRIGGQVIEVAPGFLRVAGLSAFLKLGDYVSVDTTSGLIQAQVLRISEDAAIIKAFEADVRVGPSARVWLDPPLSLFPDASWKGRAINALAHPIDDLGPLYPGVVQRWYEAIPPSPMQRAEVRRPLQTGIIAVDIFTPICAGQRIGVFAGSGVGKSTLLSLLARSAAFDTTVIALVGERGREVRDMLGSLRTGANVIAVVATGDESPMMRRLAPKTAMTVAEHFRDRGESVLLIVDSLTRFAHSARDVALSAGEPPVARGYPPSVFTDLPRLLERAGPGVKGGGSITGIFSVLVDGDDHNDPVADNLRGLLDGHIVLGRAIAEQGRYPAIDILASLSRLADRAWSPEQKALASAWRASVALYEDTRDLRLLGGYRPGADLRIDESVQLAPRLYDALKQDLAHPLIGDAFQTVIAAVS